MVKKAFEEAFEKISQKTEEFLRKLKEFKKTYELTVALIRFKIAKMQTIRIEVFIAI